MRTHGMHPVAMLWAGLVALLTHSPVAFAQDASVSARIEQLPVFVGQSFRYTISVSGSTRPDVPELVGLDPGFTVGGMLTGQQTSSRYENGRMRTTSTYDFSFEMSVDRSGAYRIPPMPVRVGGRVYQTNEVRFTAELPPETDDLRIEVSVDNTSPFVGQPIVYRLTIYATSGFSSPRFTPSGEFGRFALSDVPGWQGNEKAFEFLGGSVRPIVRREVIDGQVMLAVEMARQLTPREAGVATLGPMRVSATLLRTVQDGLFQRRRASGQVSARSDAIVVDVRPLPAEGRPAGFDGLVGRYDLHAEVEPSEVSVGDPMKLHLLVTGDPLVEAIEAPDLASLPGFAEGFRIASDAAERQSAAGGLVFTYQLRAVDDAVRQIPPIEMAYFDPEREVYGVARTRAIPLRVRPTRRVTASDAVGAEPVPSGVEVGDVRRGIAFNYEDADALRSIPSGVVAEVRAPGWVAAIAGPPVVYAVCALAVGVRRRGAGRGAVRQRSRALGEAAAVLGRAQSVDDVASAISRYFEMVTGRRGASLTPRDCEELVRPVSDEGARRLHTLMERCDAARFAGSREADVRSLATEAEALLREIDPGMRRASR